jgi:hypothetical protein
MPPRCRERSSRTGGAESTKAETPASAHSCGCPHRERQWDVNETSRKWQRTARSVPDHGCGFDGETTSPGCTGRPHRLVASEPKRLDQVPRHLAPPGGVPVRNLIGQPWRSPDTRRERPEPRRIECDQDCRVDGSRGLECGLPIPVRVDRTSGRRLARRPTTIRRRECSGDGVRRPEGWR